MHEIELVGLDGGNLLGYMAALGTLRVLTLAEPCEVRMRWVEKGWWTPVIRHARIKTGKELVATLASRVCGDASVNAAWKIGDDLTLPRVDFAGHLKTWAEAATPVHRSVADFLTAFGSDAFGTGPKKEQMSDSEFRTMSGAGHQHFLGFMRELATGTDVGHLTRAVLEPWDYGDGRPSLRWDSSDYRPHALRAEDPSGDPIKTMRGANRLAVEALPLFPTAPRNGQLRTVGFEDRSRETEISWPVWADALSAQAVASLLASCEVQSVDKFTMERRSIIQVFRARRFTDGKYRNFTPGRALI